MVLAALGRQSCGAIISWAWRSVAMPLLSRAPFVCRRPILSFSACVRREPRNQTRQSGQSRQRGRGRNRRSYQTCEPAAPMGNGSGLEIRLAPGSHLSVADLARQHVLDHDNCFQRRHRSRVRKAHENLLEQAIKPRIISSTSASRARRNRRATRI